MHSLEHKASSVTVYLFESTLFDRPNKCQMYATNSSRQQQSGIEHILFISAFLVKNTQVSKEYIILGPGDINSIRPLIITSQI